MTKQDKIKEAHRLLDIVMEIFESIFSKLDDLEIKHIETSKMENIMEIRAAEGGNIDKLWPK